MNPPDWYIEKHYNELYCYKCNNSWIKRFPEAKYPKMCPNCKQPKYWEPYKRKRL